MPDFSNNAHAVFSVSDPDNMLNPPIIEHSDLGVIAETLEPGDYEAQMSVSLVFTGDVIEVDVSLHITTDGLIDVERI